MRGFPIYFYNLLRGKFIFYHCCGTKKKKETRPPHSLLCSVTFSFHILFYLRTLFAAPACATFRLCPYRTAAALSSARLFLLQVDGISLRAVFLFLDELADFLLLRRFCTLRSLRRIRFLDFLHRLFTLLRHLGNGPFFKLHLRLIRTAVDDEGILLNGEHLAYHTADGDDLVSRLHVVSHLLRLLIPLLLRTDQEKPERHENQNQR